MFSLSTILFLTSCSNKQVSSDTNEIKNNKPDMHYYKCVKKDDKSYSVNYMSINYNTKPLTESKEEKFKRITSEQGFQECKELTNRIYETYLCEKNGKKEKVNINYLDGWYNSPEKLLELRFYESNKCELIK